MCQEDLCEVQASLVYIKFQDSQGYIKRPCFKKESDYGLSVGGHRVGLNLGPSGLLRWVPGYFPCSCTLLGRHVKVEDTGFENVPEDRSLRYALNGELFFKKKNLFYLSMCIGILPTSVCASCVCSTHRDQKGATDPPVPELDSGNLPCTIQK